MATAVRPRPDPDRHLARPVRRPARRRLPGRPGAPRLRPRRAARRPASGPACRRSAAARRSRRSTRTSRSRRSARSSGWSGVVAILGLYLVVVERGLRIGAAAADDFRALLAAGLALVIGVQAFIIAAGNLKLLPLTGITLPFISYGGSSLLANAVVVGLLLALSDKGVEPPPPPTAPEPLAPPRAGGRRVMLATSGAARQPLGRPIVHVAVVALARLRRPGRRRRLLGGRPRRPSWSRVARRRRRSSRPRGPCRAAQIIDRDGTVLARNKTDANGELYRVYAERRGQPGRRLRLAPLRPAGLERAYDAELTGLAGDPLDRRCSRKFRTDPYDPQDLTLSLSLDLQRAAVAALGKRPRRGRHARSARPARSWPWPRPRPTTRRRSPTRRPPRRPSRRSATTRPSRSCRARRRAGTCPARCSRS